MKIISVNVNISIRKQTFTHFHIQSFNHLIIYCKLIKKSKKKANHSKE